MKNEYSILAFTFAALIVQISDLFLYNPLSTSKFVTSTPHKHSFHFNLQGSSKSTILNIAKFSLPQVQTYSPSRSINTDLFALPEFTPTTYSFSLQ